MFLFGVAMILLLNLVVGGKTFVIHSKYKISLGGYENYTAYQ
jgi:hypothetical protein